MFVYDPELIGLQVSHVMGNEVQVFCPYHIDSRPSAEYNLDKGLFYCFGCQESKTAEQLVDDLGGALVPVGEFHERFHRRIGEEMDWLALAKNPIAIDSKYLSDRLVSLSSIMVYGIKENKDGIIFPIRNKFGNLEGYQIRHFTKQPKYIFYGNRQPVWPMSKVFFPGTIFITEGVFGVLRADGANINSMAMMGAGAVSNTAKFLSKIKMLKPIAFMDNDYAGQLAAGKFILHGIPAIISPFKDDPDELTWIKWNKIALNQGKYQTIDIMDIVENSDNPDKLERTLRKYWRKIK